MAARHPMLATFLGLVLVMATILPLTAQSGKPVPDERTVQILYAANVEDVWWRPGLSAGVLLWHGHYPAGVPVPLRLGPGINGFVYVEAGTLTVEATEPDGWGRRRRPMMRKRSRPVRSP